MTVVAVDKRDPGHVVFVCEWVEHGGAKTARFREEQVELYFPPRPKR